MNLFLDTSAVVKLYHRETGTDNLLSLLDECSEDLILTISELAEIEFHSAILKRVRTKEISRAIATDILRKFEQDLQQFHIVQNEAAIKDIAIQLIDEWAATLNLRTLDSIQLSSAIVTNNELALDTFVATDQRLVDVAKAYFNTYNPELQGRS